ncbi:MAG: hypothetical protein V5A56_16055 [Halolamina sp.]
MSSSNLKGDALAVFTEHRNRILAIVVALVAGTLLLGLLGFGSVLSGIFFVVYGVVWIALAAIVLWLFYRFVVGVERIASAQERIASSREAGEPESAQSADETTTDS